MTKWEYRVETEKIDGGGRKGLELDWLNNIGIEGWELVAVPVSAAAWGLLPDKVTLVFKRPIE